MKTQLRVAFRHFFYFFYPKTLFKVEFWGRNVTKSEILGTQEHTTPHHVALTFSKTHIMPLHVAFPFQNPNVTLNNVYVCYLGSFFQRVPFWTFCFIFVPFGAFSVLAVCIYHPYQVLGQVTYFNGSGHIGMLPEKAKMYS